MPGVDREFHADRGEQALHLLKVRAAVVAEVIEDLRRGFRDLAADRALAVEDAHRVALEARIARLAEFFAVRGEVRLERLVVLGAARRAADRVDRDLHVVAEAEPLEDRLAEQDDLRVRGRLRRAEHLDAELVQLAHAARLRLFIAVAGRLVVHLDREAVVVHAVFKHRAHRAGRALGAQRDRAAALVRKRVHLLFDDVRRVADRALEQLRVLEHRRADLGEAVELGLAGHHILNERPFFRFARDDVSCAFRRFCDQFHMLSLPPHRSAARLLLYLDRICF